MATLWAVDGPHTVKSSLKAVYRSLRERDGNFCVVSKNADNGLHLGDDDKVSKGAHAKVWYEDERFWLADDGSTNGTWVPDGDTLIRLGTGQKVPLNSMDEFVVGDTTVVLHNDDLDPAEMDRLREERHKKGIRSAATLPRKVSGTEGETVT